MKLTANTQKPNELHYAIYQSSDQDCLFRGAKHWDENKSSKYRQVCSVNYYGGLTESGNEFYIDGNDDVYALLNGVWADDETGEDVVHDNHVVGYGIREGTRKDGSEYCFRDMHSLSIGDIIVDNVGSYNGQAYIVDGVGFQKIQFNAYEATATREAA
jgi:hypothetical protein|tara:strand:+ start:169 stop:642 length:474 start_codon:yes stop_codon:yes gene_type:complete